MCRGCDVVDQIWVYGNSYESTLVAIVVPDKKQLMGWAKENGLGSDFKTVCQKPEVRPPACCTGRPSTLHSRARCVGLQLEWAPSAMGYAQTSLPACCGV